MGLTAAMAQTKYESSRNFNLSRSEIKFELKSVFLKWHQTCLQRKRVTVLWFKGSTSTYSDFTITLTEDSIPRLASSLIPYVWPIHISCSKIVTSSVVVFLLKYGTMLAPQRSLEEGGGVDKIFLTYP